MESNVITSNHSAPSLVEQLLTDQLMEWRRLQPQVTGTDAAYCEAKIIELENELALLPAGGTDEPLVDDHDMMTYDQAHNYIQDAQTLFKDRFNSSPTFDQIIDLASMLVQIDLKTALANR